MTNKTADKSKEYEAINITGLNHTGARANTPLKRLTATSIIGDKVVNRAGKDLGNIQNLMINLRSGVVEYVVVEFGGFLGVGEKLFAIPFRELSVHERDEVFVLDRDKDYLKDSPGFDPAHWPDTNDHSYFDDVNAYYQYPVTPFP
jgi:sporulation protein YlmC with PRC-barrel domain